MTIDLSYFDRWVIAPYAICLFGSVLIGLVYIAVRLKHSGIKTHGGHRLVGTETGHK